MLMLILIQLERLSLMLIMEPWLMLLLLAMVQTFPVVVAPPKVRMVSPCKSVYARVRVVPIVVSHAILRIALTIDMITIIIITH